MKNSLFLLSSVFTFLFIGNLYSQNDFTLPEITRPSPTVSALMKFEEVNLNHYTGQPNIAIPLFSKNINGLNYNLALQYQVSGIRVDEQSGWVGKGWALDAGGVISRSVVGLPDDINKEAQFLGINHNQFYDFWDWDYSFQNPSNFDANGSLIVGSDAYKAREYFFDALWANDDLKLDYQRDIYQFNFFGHTGRFIFVKDANGNIIPEIIGNDSKLKIQVTYESTTINNHYDNSIKSFRIIDTKGFVYTFDEVELTDKYGYSLVYPQVNNGLGVSPQTGDEIGEYRSAWKISKVETFQGDVLVEFFYNSVLEKPNYPSSTIEKTLKYPVAHGGGLCEKSAMDAALEPLRVSTSSIVEIDSKKIDKIVFGDSVSIHFQSSGDHPEYLGVKLNAIAIKTPTGFTNKSYNFEYNQDMLTLPSNTTIANNNGLLFLNELKENNSNVHKYTFNYGDGLSNLTVYGENQKDMFGYYRSNNMQTKHLEVTSGALHKITYPTGGERILNWGSNSYSFNGDKLLTFEDIIENPENYSLINNYGLHQSKANSIAYPESNNQLIYVGFDQKVSLDYSFLLGGSNVEPYNMSIYYKPVFQNGTNDPSRENGNFLMNSSLGKDIILETGYYHFYVAQNPLLLVDEPYASNMNEHDVHVNLNIKTKSLVIGSLNWWAYGGGLRINSIVDKDRGETQSITRFDYGLDNETLDDEVLNQVDNPVGYPGSSSIKHNFSSGSVDGVLSLNRKYQVSIRPVYTLPQRAMNALQYNVKETLSELSAQLTKGSYVGYKNIVQYKAIEDEISDPIAGPTLYFQTRYTYDSPIDEPIYPEHYAYPFPPLKDKDYLRGNLKQMRMYDENNLLLKEVNHTYNFEEGDIEIVVGQSINFLINETGFANATDISPYMFSVQNQMGLSFGNLYELAMGYIFVIRKSYPNFEGFYINDSNNYQISACSGQFPSTVEAFLEGFYDPKEDFTRVVMDELTINRLLLQDKTRYQVLTTSTNTKEYFYDGTETVDPLTNEVIPTKIVESHQEFDYYAENNQVKEQHTYYSEQGQQQHLQLNYTYSITANEVGTVTLNAQNRIN